MNHPRRDDRGAAPLEAAMVIPVLLLFIGMAIAAGRLAVAHNTVASAAGAAARAASVERGSSNSIAAGQAVAASTLANSFCTPTTTITGNFDSPPGTPATATADVTCSASLSDIALPGLPGSITLHATATSVIDEFRGR